MGFITMRGVRERTGNRFENISPIERMMKDEQPGDDIANNMMARPIR